LYRDTDDAPVIFKDLPQYIQTGDKIYYRLMDILDDKGKEMFDFGKVIVSFRNFRVTANFNPQLVELIRVEDGSTADNELTYNLATPRIINAFDEVFRKAREIENYVALPQGTYILRLNTANSGGYTPLTRFYVRANQEQYHILEPLADWIILYENPTSKRPDFYKYRRNNQGSETGGFASNLNFNQTNGHTSASKTAPVSAVGEVTSHEQLVAEIVAAYLSQFDIKLMFDLNDPAIKDNAVQIIARSVVGHVESRNFYNEWNLWTASWDISKKVREIISPGSLIPIELVELIYKVIREL
jgi:hypothetical protein